MGHRPSCVPVVLVVLRYTIYDIPVWSWGRRRGQGQGCRGCTRHDRACQACVQPAPVPVLTSPAQAPPDSTAQAHSRPSRHVGTRRRSAQPLNDQPHRASPSIDDSRAPTMHTWREQCHAVAPSRRTAIRIAR
eukprot:2999164-Prymnesium_polylepis.1